MSRVYLAQCLCPQRHAILAASGEALDQIEAEAEVLAPLKAAIGRLVAMGGIGRECGLCGASDDTWTYDVGRTPWRTMAEAKPHLEELERQQAAVNAAFGDRHKRQRPN